MSVKSSMLSECVALPKGGGQTKFVVLPPTLFVCVSLGPKMYLFG
jgi:hypothetical protein